MNRLLISILLLLLGACSATTDQQHNSEAELAVYFAPREVSDTLHLGREVPADWAVRGIPQALLSAVIDSASLERISYYWAEADSAMALGRFALPDGREACWFQIRYSWYVHGGLLLYDPKAATFQGVIPVSYLDGGDGGQILGESWLLDWDADGKKDLLTHHFSHQLRMQEVESEDDEPEILVEDLDSLSLQVWKETGFQDAPIAQDSALFQQFPIDW